MKGGVIVIDIKRLSVIYPNGAKALDDINLTFSERSVTGIIGPNGAGKSTLMKSILNLVSHSGKITIDGEDATKELKQIAYVEQKSHVDYTFPITVRECVSLGVYPNLGLFRRPKAKDWKNVDEALDDVGLADFAGRQISELSGGQFQRILMARCLVQGAKYIFLDEPFVGIDSVSEAIIMRILKELKENGKTVLIVHHDLSKVKAYFDNLVILNKELITIGKTTDVFTPENLVKAYGDNVVIQGGNKNDK